MIDHSKSPFDVALSRPFLDEPTRKKWSVKIPRPTTSWLHCFGGNTRKKNMPTSSGGGSCETISFESNSDDNGETGEDCPLLHESILSCDPVLSPLSQHAPKEYNQNKSEVPGLMYQQDTTTSSANKNIFEQLGHELTDAHTGGITTPPRRLQAVSTDQPTRCRGSFILQDTSQKHDSLQPHEQGIDNYDWIEADGEGMMMELVPLTSPDATFSRDVEAGVDAHTVHNSLDPFSALASGDIAIMTEREAELTNITSSMRHINTIQRDLAEIVDSQGLDIHRLSWRSIEAFGHAQSGLEHLVKTVKSREDRKTKLYTILASMAVVLGFCYIVAGFFSSDQRGPATDPEDEQGPPKFLVPVSMFLP